MSRRLIGAVLRCTALTLLIFSGCQCEDPTSTPKPVVDMGEIDMSCPAGTTCPQDPCLALNCSAPRGRCEIIEAQAVCLCDAGTIERDGQCVVDPCEPDPCAGIARSVCQVVQEQAICVCAPGAHEEGGVCVMDTTCEPTTCHGHGACTQAQDGLMCACDAGFGGQFCERCDEAGGFFEDGQGGCTKDPCAQLSCSTDRRCVLADDVPSCVCVAGTHEEGNSCVPDSSCQPNSCGGHGQCAEVGGRVECRCEAGWELPSCGSCDAAAGYHPDGQGGCTQDPCLPNPCDQANKTTCQANGDMAVCLCDVGYHLNSADECVVDELCQPDSCSGHGQCDDSTKEVTCACLAGYMGPTCASCDVAAGYHEDGVGGCTLDPCLPNPCGEPNKTSCQSAANMNGFVCSCDVDYHPDGQGGCTQDPCLPDLCAAQNKSCRVENGQAQCFTPACDDLNPCTDDTVVSGQCVNTPRADNLPCATDVCVVNQSCQQGQCVGGAARACDDLNPCTDDACVIAQGGCVSIPDDNNIPDDGIACTEDVCMGGISTNSPQDMRCDDGLYCSGQELCRPNDMSADASGCVVTNIPQPPQNSSPCQLIGACDEQTQSFPLVPAAVGMTCDDGITCTTGDACDAQGRCQGTLLASCPGATCNTTQPLGALDVPLARITPTVTYDGQDPNVLRPSGSFTIYGIHKETGTWHSIAYYSSGFGADKLIEGERLMPGVYDVLYAGGSFSEADRINTYSYNTGTSVTTGMQYLQRDVVITRGQNVLSFNVPLARITPVVTYDGQDPNVLRPSGSFTIYGIHKETGTWHSIAYYSSGFGADKLIEGERLMPGEYDILYAGGSFSEADRINTYGYNTGTGVTTGMQYLQRNVTISAAGPNNLSFDVPLARITPTVTYDGQDPNVLRPSGSFTIYGIHKETGTWHSIAYYSSGFGADKLIEGERLMPGEYDILYAGGSFSESDRINTYSYNTGTSVTTGMQYLQRNVTINAVGANVLTINVPLAQITPTVTYDGQDPNVLRPSGSFTIYGIHKETGTWHSIAYYSSGFGADKLIEGERLMPGEYDILYAGGSFSESDRINTYSYNTGTSVTTGMQYLQRNVTINAVGANVLSFDVPLARITPTVTYDGQDPNVLRPGGSFTIYGIHKETGTWHSIAYYSSGFGADKLIEGERLMPGEYDILYAGGSFSESDRINTYSYNTGTSVTTGMQYLQRNVTINAVGANVLSFDVPLARITPVVTYDGQDPNVLRPSGSFTIYGIHKETSTWHSIAYYSSGFGADKLIEGERLMPGEYDILYAGGSFSEADRINTYSYNTGTGVTTGMQYLNLCVAIQ